MVKLGIFCYGKQVCATATRGACVIQASTSLAIWWWEHDLNLTASLVTQTTHTLVGISKGTGGSRVFASNPAPVFWHHTQTLS